MKVGRGIPQPHSVYIGQHHIDAKICEQPGQCDLLPAHTVGVLLVRPEFLCIKLQSTLYLKCTHP